MIELKAVATAGVGLTNFGNFKDQSDLTIIDIALEASTKAIEDANITIEDLGGVIVGSMAPGEFVRQTNLATMIADYLGLIPKMAIRTESGPSSGASAVETAIMTIAAGFKDLILVVGVEKMTEVSGKRATSILATMTDSLVELQHGVSLPSLAGLVARLHMQTFGTTREQLAKIAVKNHTNGANNPISHFKKIITIETVLNSPMIADPLRLYDFCPISDGAAALVLGTRESVSKISDTPITFTGIGHGTDHVAVQYRSDLTGFLAIRQAAEEAFRMARLDCSEIDVAELHDAFTILELSAYEDIGFVKKGEGGKAVDEGIFEMGGRMPVNPSGGLKARGHPVGATGVAQIAEIVYQLRGEAEKRQVEGAEYGLTSNVGGFGNNVICFILQN